MAIKKYGPTTPGRRGMTVTDYSVLSKVAPERSLLEPMKKHSGRNNTGKITVRHHGGGNRTKYRVIDFKRQKLDVPATVKTIEYDPNRSAFICLIEYTDGVKSYIVCPEGLKVGDTIISGAGADIKPGNCLPFENIPVGTIIHNIELYPGRGAQLVRSAGNMAQLMAKENGYALIRLPSGEMRNVPLNCTAVIGQGRPQAPHGHPSRQPRFCHEPQRPSPRRWRGPRPDRPLRTYDPLGQARTGPQDPQASQALRQADREACRQVREECRPWVEVLKRDLSSSLLL